MQTNTTTQPNAQTSWNGAIPTYPSISLAELEEKSISVDESERLLTEQIHNFYHPAV